MFSQIDRVLIIDEAIGRDGRLVPDIIGNRGFKVVILHSRLPLVSSLLFQHGAVGDFIGHGGASDLKGNEFVAQIGWGQRRYAFLFHVNEVSRGKIDVDRRGNRIALVIGAILGAMKMERLNGIGGVRQGKSVAKHVASEGIVATRLAKTEGKGRQVPFAVLDGIGEEDPTVLGVCTRAKEFRLGLSTRRRFADVPAKQTEHAVGQLDPPEFLKRLIPIDIGVTQNGEDM